MIALSFSFPHHGKYSSYHRLLHYLKSSDRIVDASLPSWVYSRYFNPRDITQKYWRARKEREAWKYSERENHSWMHYLYPEHSYFVGKKLYKPDTKLVMSCHLPEEALERGGDKRKALKEGLSISNTLIVMSPDYLEYYQSLAPDAKVIFIPHGIDVHYFKPAGDSRVNRKSDQINVLTVGNMLRDFETLAKVMNIAAQNSVKWKFQVVALKDRLDYLDGLLTESARAIYEPLCKISNDHLLRLYQKSDLLYLPLLDATANNAVVEAMSCGLPMLLTDFPATRAYAQDTAQYISGRNPDDAFARIKEMVSDIDSLEVASKQLREHAVDNLSWEKIVARQYACINY